MEATAGLTLDESAVDVWIADLDAVGSRHEDLLSREERARAGRFLRERDGRRWAAAHGVLRALLGEYLGSDPSALRFATGAHGKPRLLTGADANGAREPRFNMAHSGWLALYAVARARQVGVDVELVREPPPRRRDTLAIAERALGAPVARRLARLDGAAREREFLREWVKHEAIVKCTGTGLAGGDTDERGRRPWVAELEVGAGAAAALGVMGERCEVRLARYMRP